MTPYETLTRRLLSYAAQFQQAHDDLVKLAEDLSERAELDSITKVTIEQSYSEAILKEGPRRVLEFIRKNKVVRRTDITQRFSRTFTAAQLFEPGGIVDELVAQKLIEFRMIPGPGRTAMAYSIPAEIMMKSFHAKNKVVPEVKKPIFDGGILDFSAAPEMVEEEGDSDVT